MDDKNPNRIKSHYISNNYFSERQDFDQETEEQQLQEVGSLGGEVSSELGFADLEAAREYAEQYKPWNSEEWELMHEEMIKKNKNRVKSR